jgi:YesN/AraC family two-component response regulator
MDKISIIIADYQLFRKGLVSLIEDVEIIERIYEAGDGLECLVYLKKQPFSNLVLLDLKMPNLDGMDTTMKFKTISFYQNYNTIDARRRAFYNTHD